MFSFTTLSKFWLRFGLVSLALWTGTSTVEASEPPLVEPSPVGDLKTGGMQQSLSEMKITTDCLRLSMPTTTHLQ